MFAVSRPNRFLALGLTFSLLAFEVPSRNAEASVVDPEASHARVAAVAACSSIDWNQVSAQVADLRAMKHVRPIAPGPNPLIDPVGFHAFVASTMPRFAPRPSSWHVSTAAEEATERAALVIARTGASIPHVLQDCHERAAASLQAASRMLQSCQNPPCEPPVLKYASDTNGNYADIYTSGQTATGTSTFSKTGTKTLSGSNSGVTIKNLYNPATNSYITVPGVQTAVSGNASSTTAVPQPAYVPQTGWVVLPGTNYWMYLNQSNDTAVVQLDGSGNNYYIVSTTGSGGFEVSFHVYESNGTLVQKTTAIASASSGNGGDARTRSFAGGFSRDVTLGEAALTLGVVAAGVGGVLIGVGGAAAIAGWLLVGEGAQWVVNGYLIDQYLAAQKAANEDYEWVSDGEGGDEGGGCDARTRSVAQRFDESCVFDGDLW